jgi:hypothetical protein
MGPHRTKLVRDLDTHYDVRDRFTSLRPTEIAEHCHELARDLRRKGVTRTSADRLALALDVAAILTRVAERITGEIHGGSLTPERTCVLNGTPVSEAYLDWIRSEINSARYRALDRAGELVFGKDSRGWLGGGLMGFEARDMRKVIQRLRDLDAIVAMRVAAGERKFGFLRSKPTV